MALSVEQKRHRAIWRQYCALLVDADRKSLRDHPSFMNTLRQVFENNPFTPANSPLAFKQADYIVRSCRRFAVGFREVLAVLKANRDKEIIPFVLEERIGFAHSATLIDFIASRWDSWIEVSNPYDAWDKHTCVTKS